MKKLRLLAIVLAVLMLLSACAKTEVSTVTQTTAEAETTVSATEAETVQDDTDYRVSFSTVDLDGNPVDSSVFADAEYTMINIWASYCAPCIGEMDELMQMDAELENVQIITVLSDALSTEDEAAEDAREIVKTLNFTLPVYLINEEIYTQLPCNAVPTSFLVDREGNAMKYMCVGAVGVEQYKQWIQSCIDSQGD